MKRVARARGHAPTNCWRRWPPRPKLLGPQAAPDVPADQQGVREAGPHRGRARRAARRAPRHPGSAGALGARRASTRRRAATRSWRTCCSRGSAAINDESELVADQPAARRALRRATSSGTRTPSPATGPSCTASRATPPRWPAWASSTSAARTGRACSRSTTRRSPPPRTRSRRPAKHVQGRRGARGAAGARGGRDRPLQPVPPAAAGLPARAEGAHPPLRAAGALRRAGGDVRAGPAADPRPRAAHRHAEQDGGASTRSGSPTSTTPIECMRRVLELGAGPPAHHPQPGAAVRARRAVARADRAATSARPSLAGDTKQVVSLHHRNAEILEEQLQGPRRRHRRLRARAGAVARRTCPRSRRWAGCTRRTAAGTS